VEVIGAQRIVDGFLRVDAGSQCAILDAFWGHSKLIKISYSVVLARGR
jgi:hypothetical protein